MGLFTIVVLFSLISMVLGNPYHVPLQGKQGGKRTAVLLDELTETAKYSNFFHDLRARHHQLSFFTAESEDLELKKYGENLFDNIILFSSSLEKFRTITFEDFSEFVEEGGNMLIAADKDVSNELRDFVEGFGIVFDKRGSEVIDHFYVEESIDLKAQHTSFYASNVIDSKPVLGSFHGKHHDTPILYRGIAHSIADDNILAVRILRGNPSSYSFHANKPMSSEGPYSSGDRSLLVSGIQGRNNARVLVSGSLEMFNNFFMAVPPSDGSKARNGNHEFVQNIAKWVFCEQGVLRFRDIVHHTADGTPPDVILHEKERPDLPVTLYPDPEIARNALVYRIKDQIIYSMIVEELVDNVWQPFQANDMQMEFVMLDPYVRKTMTSDHNGKFVANFTAPDNYGVFKFRVLYRRTGYSVIHAETQVSLRPFKHNEYERFITAAYPYYLSAFSAMIAFAVFSFVFFYSE